MPPDLKGQHSLQVTLSNSTAEQLISMETPLMVQLGVLQLKNAALSYSAAITRTNICFVSH